MKNEFKGNAFNKADNVGLAGTSNPWGCSYFVSLSVLMIFAAIGVSVAVADWLESRVPAKCACASDDAAAGSRQPCHCCRGGLLPGAGAKPAETSEATDNTKKHDKSAGQNSAKKAVTILRKPLSKLLNSVGLFKGPRSRR